MHFFCLFIILIISFCHVCRCLISCHIKTNTQKKYRFFFFSELPFECSKTKKVLNFKLYLSTNNIIENSFFSSINNAVQYCSFSLFQNFFSKLSELILKNAIILKMRSLLIVIFSLQLLFKGMIRILFNHFTLHWFINFTFK